MLAARRLAQSHASGGAGIVARREMRAALAQTTPDEFYRDAPDCGAFHLLVLACSEWTAISDDAARERLSPVVFALTEAVRNGAPHRVAQFERRARARARIDAGAPGTLAAPGAAG